MTLISPYGIPPFFSPKGAFNTLILWLPCPPPLFMVKGFAYPKVPLLALLGAPQ